VPSPSTTRSPRTWKRLGRGRLDVGRPVEHQIAAHQRLRGGALGDRLEAHHPGAGTLRAVRGDRHASAHRRPDELEVAAGQRRFPEVGAGEQFEVAAEPDRLDEPP
jgi:hypothetical protein